MTDLNLSGTWFTDDAVEIIVRSAPDLSSLNLSDTYIKDHHLTYLKGLSKLRRLSLRATGITDAGMSELAGIVSIYELDLSSTVVSDECLEGIANLPKIQLLDLRNTSCTVEGIAKLKDRLPRLTIEYP